MKPVARVAVVAGGYIAAVLIASAATAIRIAATSGPVAQASSGMYAFGDSMLWLGAFGICALAPTGAALYFLRPHPRFWNVLSVVALVVAATGLVSAVLFGLGRRALEPPLMLWAQASVLRILVAPLIAITFLVCALFSPFRRPQVALLVATAIEAGVTAYGWLTWLLG